LSPFLPPLVPGVEVKSLDYRAGEKGVSPTLTSWGPLWDFHALYPEAWGMWILYSLPALPFCFQAPLKLLTVF
jgi:hypothetical protein